MEDRFGNTVQYQYNAAGHPTRIWSNDGREITLTYSSGRLASATSHGRTWQYQYDANGQLSAVVRPDSSRWQYSYTGSLFPYTSESDTVPPLAYCMGFGPMLEASYTLDATHPSGATGQFEFSNHRHSRSGVSINECVQTGDASNPTYELKVPHYFDVLGLDRKVIAGPGIAAPMTWDYAYTTSLEPLWGTWGTQTTYPCTTCTQEKATTVTAPDGTATRHWFGMQYYFNDGRLLRVETLDEAGAILRTQTTTYMTDAQAAGQPFHPVYGSVPYYVSDPVKQQVRPVVERRTLQQGVTFKWHANAFDGYAMPVDVTRSSTLSGSPLVRETIQYYHHEPKWILGQVARLMCIDSSAAKGCESPGREVSSTSYDGTYALPLQTERFGKPQQTLAYDLSSSLSTGQRGTLKSVTDGNGNTTQLAGWKRGIPTQITYPATPEAPGGATQSAAVNDSGWITRITDENGYDTSYGYDAMGRLAEIVYPTGDSVAWADTTIAFAQVATSEYGIPANHWRQTISTGNARKVTYFDALWRPLVIREYDAANVSATQRFQRFAYDHEGRTTFTAYPGTSASLSTGTWTEYDALGRPESVAQDSELGLLQTGYEYQSGFNTKVTNARGKATTTSYLAWDTPTTEFPTRVAMPEGAWTHITRDAFGKPTQIRRSNSSSPTGGTVAVNRTYRYHPSQELCAVTEPETGTTLMGYDGAGNLAWSAAGLPAGTACDEEGDTVAILNRKVVRTYDARNRVKTLAFPDLNGNQSWTYTPDGLPETVTTTNSGGATTVVNEYSYNQRRLLTGESQAQTDGQSVWHVGYAYSPEGHRAAIEYPQLLVDYAPDALGQPTHVTGLPRQAGSPLETYATGIGFFPNGALKQFTYGNGIVHTMTRNARGLPEESRDAYGSSKFLHDIYDYDQVGNVAAITDGATGQNQHGNRTMTYDGLDRLTDVASPMYGSTGAHYTYDVLDNITRTVAVNRDQTLCYDEFNRLATVKTNGTCSTGQTILTLAYDVQGNLADWNGKIHNFDYGNRLRSVSGVESYRYDAYGRRVRAWTPSQGLLYSLYSQSGQLLWQRDARAGERREYIYLQGTLVAERTRGLSGSTATITYQHTDALGSPVAKTNASRVVIQRREYEPYGKLLNAPLESGPGYTGHDTDPDTQYVYMQQRYYDPRVGRFLSVDPVTAYSDPVGQFNRYRYANNNPFRFIDPDGRLSSDETEKNEQPLTDLATVVVTGQKLPTTPPTKTFPAVRVVGRPMPAPTPWGPLVAEWTISLGARIVSGVGLAVWPTELDAPPCEMPGGPPCGMAMSGPFPPGYWPGDEGAAAWGRKNGVGASEGKRRFHRGVKENTPGSRGDHDYGVNPDTGEVVDQNGEPVGNLNDE